MTMIRTPFLKTLSSLILLPSPLATMIYCLIPSRTSAEIFRRHVARFKPTCFSLRIQYNGSFSEIAGGLVTVANFTDYCLILAASCLSLTKIGK